MVRRLLTTATSMTFLIRHGSTSRKCMELSQLQGKVNHAVCVRRDMYFFGGQGNSILRDGENIDNFYNDLYRLRIRFDDESRLHATATWDLVEPKGPKPSKEIFTFKLCL